LHIAKKWRCRHELKRVCDQIHLYEFVNFAHVLLDVALGRLTLVVHIEARVGVDLHEPGVELLVDEDVQAQNLEAARVFVVIGRDEAVVGVLEVGLERNYGLGGELLDLLLEHGDVLAAHLELLVQVGEQLLAGVRIQICVVLPSDLELLRLLVQTVVGQVHVQVLHVQAVGLFVVGSAEAGDSLVADVRFNLVHALNEHIEPKIEFLVIN